jgi:hypothetical protein
MVARLPGEMGGEVLGAGFVRFEVQHDQVGAVASGQLEPRSRAAGCQGLQSASSQCGLQDLAGVVGMIDNQHAPLAVQIPTLPGGWRWCVLVLPPGSRPGLRRRVASSGAIAAGGRDRRRGERIAAVAPCVKANCVKADCCLTSAGVGETMGESDGDLPLFSERTLPPCPPYCAFLPDCPCELHRERLRGVACPRVFGLGEARLSGWPCYG